MRFQTFPLAFSADAHYGPALGVTLSSLLATQAKESPPFDLYILDGGILEKDKQKIEALVQKEEKAHKLTWFPLKGQYAELPLSEHFTSAAYYRFALPRLLPAELDWMVYVDVDIVVLADLAPFYAEIEKQEKWAEEEGRELPLLGAMEDPFTLLAPEEYREEHVYSQKGLGLERDVTYFISSPLVMNLKKMREQGLEETLQAQATLYRDKIRYVDQDVYNVTCQRDRFLLSFGYSYVPMLDSFSFEEVKRAGTNVSEEDFEKGRRQPLIIHYAGRKPCLPMSILPSYVKKQTRQREFFEAWQASPWSGEWVYQRYFLQRLGVALGRRKGLGWLRAPLGWGLKLSWAFGRFFWVKAMERALFSSQRRK